LGEKGRKTYTEGHGEAQRATEKRRGRVPCALMNADYAEENYKLLLNIIHWLEGKM
jgi:hypothetical protein